MISGFTLFLLYAKAYSTVVIIDTTVVASNITAITNEGGVVAFLADATVGEMQIPNNGELIEFGDVDSGQNRTMEYLLFSNQQQIAGVAIMINGWEIDGTDEFRDVVADFDLTAKRFVGQTLIYYNEEEYKCTTGVSPDDPFYVEWRRESSSFGLAGLIILVALLYFMIKGIIALIDAILGAWGPADPIIDDTISLTTLDLLHLTSTAIPLPPPYQYDVNGIKVKVTPIEKSNNQYRESREYISDDEGSRYE